MKGETVDDSVARIGADGSGPSRAGERTKRLKNQLWLFVINWIHVVSWLAPYPVDVVIMRRLGATIGRSTSLDFGVYFKFPWLVRIGRSCSVNRGVEFFGDWFSGSSITLGDHVRVGPHARFFASGHDLESEHFHRHVGADISVGDGSWIGGGALILPGVNIGEGSVIAAGSVVTADVPDHVVYGGCPARLLRRLESSADAGGGSVGGDHRPQESAGQVDHTVASP